MKSPLNINRRDFIISSLAGAGLFYLATKYHLSAETNDKILIGTSGSRVRTDIYHVAPSDNKERIFACHISTGKVQTIDVPLRGHQISQHPFEKNLIFTSEKWGLKSVLVDLKTEKVLALAQSEDGTRFFGHSLFSGDGKYIICSELDDKIGESYLGCRDSRTLKLIKRIPTRGIFAHQIASADNGKTVMVMNAGAYVQSNSKNAPHWQKSPVMHSDSKLNLIDLHSEQLIKSTSLGRSGFAHFALDQTDGSAVVVGHASPEGDPSLVSIVKADGSVVDLNKSKVVDYKTEALNVCLDTKNKIAYISIPEVSVLLKVDYRTNQVLDRLSLDHTRGMVLDGDDLFISSPHFARARNSSSPMKNWPWQQWSLPEASYGSHLALLDSYHPETSISNLKVLK